MLRGDIVKDYGVHAVFAKQRSSASQMTAAEVMDVIASLPHCDGQASDAVSAYTQVKMEDAPKPDCSQFQDQNVLMYGYVFHDTDGRNHG